MKPFVLASTILAVSLSVVAARADGPTGEVTESELSHAEKPVQIHVDVGAGASTYGINLGAIGLVKLGAFELGPALNFSGLFDSKLGGGVALGVGTQGCCVNVDVLAELGANGYWLAGPLLSDEPASSATIPYAGGRFGIRWTPPRPRVVRFSLGAWLYVQYDLDSTNKLETYSSTNWFSGATRQETTVKHFGGQTEVGARLAFGFDVSPF
ncbi:hypothetical protein AKJ09_04080 [Labilithrix luteola]|uniref:Outer membrane protein beta-barrel domain-containing protein n=1 Tax=Labilithrix luteola TaxID=1391654 RepID=A0A0K1PVL4_9BACT|nr:hypothetical protein [Labilithrix luteola]AKU97416.1 hypothetical protein AKJ09_04080 [Labilithrix luteola]